MCKTSSSCKLACNSWSYGLYGYDATARRCRRCLKSMITGKFVINLWDNGNERYPSWHGCVVSVCAVWGGLFVEFKQARIHLYVYTTEIPLCFMYMSNTPSARHYIVCRVQSVFVWAPACRVCALVIHTQYDPHSWAWNHIAGKHHVKAAEQYVLWLNIECVVCLREALAWA